MKTKKTKKAKTRTIEVPAELFAAADRKVKELIAINTIRKPIKRVVSISTSQLQALHKKGKAAKHVLYQIKRVLVKEGSRLCDLSNTGLNTADERWVDTQLDRLYKVGGSLEVDMDMEFDF